MPVTRNFVDTAVVSRAAGAGIGSVLVDFKNARQHDWPVIVIELVGEEERAGKAVVLRTMVTVVLVGGNGVASEAVVRVHISRQPVVMAEQDRLTVTALNQVRRNGAVEGPHRVRVLSGEARMEFQRNRLSGINAGIQRGSHGRVIGSIRGGLCLRGLKAYLGQELIEALVRPD